MKWLIASDIHGSEYYCRKVLETFDREGAERMLLLGDVLYHGPRNDLPRDYCPRAVAELLNAREGSVIGVRGNCDAEIDQAVLHFPILADYALLCEGGRTTGICTISTVCRRCTRGISCCTAIRTFRPAWKKTGSFISTPALRRSRRKARPTAS